MKRIECRIIIIIFVLCMFLVSCEGEKTDIGVAPAPAKITFAAFGNTGMDTDDGAVFRRLASELQNHSIDFAVELGNKLPVGVPPSGASALLKAVDKEMERIPAPVYPVAGPNDVFDYYSDSAYRDHYGPMWYSFERGGVIFIMLNTADESYRSGFGESSAMGEEQIGWLWDKIEDFDATMPVVVCMNSPVWEEDSGLWQDRLMPVFKEGDIDLIVTCGKNGLYDWGTVDGIRAVSTGCTGPVANNGIGLFPHILLITINGDTCSFRVMYSDGRLTDSIGIDENTREMADEIIASVMPPVLKTGRSWEVNQSLELVLDNTFDESLSGSIDFTTFNNTSWTVDPPELHFSIAPAVKKTFRIGIRGRSPELSPPPAYDVNLQVGDIEVVDSGGSLLREIPPPRMGETVPLTVRAAKTVPYSFDNRSLKFPFEINGPDTCGRLIIYNDTVSEIPVCVHRSSLRNFKDGLNEMTWNGVDLDGKKVVADSLSYYLFVYNKTAPPTWVAEGPQSPVGTLEIERTLSGLIARTHTENTLIKYRVAGSVGPPSAERIHSFDDVLDGLSLTGYAFDSEDRIFLTTQKGIVCAYLSGGVVRPDVSFGDRGYVLFSEYRGHSVGTPAVHGGIVYAGVGAREGRSAVLLAFDTETGEIVRDIPLGEYFGMETSPPVVKAEEKGVYITNPDSGTVLFLDHDGELIWMNETGDMVGDVDTDGRSFTHGIGLDQFGFSYVNTPGYSARCGVLGPDGKALFRVILVILPGLRVGHAVPMVEGKSTDGLYFATHGGDKPYVFHVPFTVRAGKIIDEDLVMSR